MTIKPADFELYKTLLKKESGLVITPDKSYLLESRLSPVAKKWNLDGIEALTTALRSAAPDKVMLNDVIEAMTTNETSFFRDSRPFDLFKEFVLPYFIQSRAAQRKLRLWCAAASTGQEPYSISMILKEEQEAKMAGWSVDIKATDISNEVLDIARAGQYTQFEVQRGLPIQYLMKYFTQKDEKWELTDDIKKMVKYEYFNLLDGMSGLGKFDIVFCRNVLIYFDEADKSQILERISKQMEPDGLLFLGGAETVLGISKEFLPVPNRRGLYAMKDSAHLQEEKALATEEAATATKAAG